MFRGNGLCSLSVGWFPCLRYNMAVKTLVFLFSCSTRVFAIAEVLNGVFYTTALSNRKSVPRKTQKNVSDLTMFVES